MTEVYQQEDIDQLALEWVLIAEGRSTGEPTEFFRFIAIWIAFNALYASRYHWIRREPDQVETFFSDRAKLHLSLLRSSEPYAEAVETISMHNGGNGVYNCKRALPGNSAPSNKAPEYWGLADVEDAKALARCLYGIRCNLFHGNKCPTNLRDERLVRAAKEILERIVRAELDEFQTDSASSLT